MFKKELETSADIYDSNKANIYLYLNKDVEYFQDGTRLSEIERDLLDSSHRNVLIDYNIDIIELKGDWNQRFNKAVEQINELILSIELK